MAAVGIHPVTKSQKDAGAMLKEYRTNSRVSQLGFHSSRCVTDRVTSVFADSIHFVDAFARQSHPSWNQLRSTSEVRSESHQFLIFFGNFVLHIFASFVFFCDRVAIGGLEFQEARC